jgi:hypothetical protein
MEPHNRARVGRGHGIGGMEIRKNIALHFIPAGRRLQGPEMKTWIRPPSDGFDFGFCDFC